MNTTAKIAACFVFATAFGSAAADDTPPVPKLLQGIHPGKGAGQWRMEPLEGPGGQKGRAMPAMTICTENMAREQSKREAKADPSCQHRMLKDTASEALMESTCKDRTTKVSMKREGDKSVLVELDSTRAGRAEPMHMKMRYTYLGGCTPPAPGQGGVQFDRNSPMCEKLKGSPAYARMCGG